MLVVCELCCGRTESKQQVLSGLNGLLEKPQAQAASGAFEDTQFPGFGSFGVPSLLPPH